MGVETKGGYQASPSVTLLLGSRHQFKLDRLDSKARDPPASTFQHWDYTAHCHMCVHWFLLLFLFWRLGLSYS